MPRDTSDVTVSIRKAPPKIKVPTYTIFLQLNGRDIFIASYLSKARANTMCFLSRLRSGRDYYVQ